MKMYMYSIKDNYLNVYSRPEYSQYDPETYLELNTRAIAAKKIPEELMKKDLYFLGTFDDKTGTIMPIEKEYLLTYPEMETIKDETKK